MEDEDYYEVIVIGGGPAGFKAATEAATSGKSVCIVDPLFSLHGLSTGAHSKCLREVAAHRLPQQETKTDCSTQTIKGDVSSQPLTNGDVGTTTAQHVSGGPQTKTGSSTTDEFVSASASASASHDESASAAAGVASVAPRPAKLTNLNPK